MQEEKKDIMENDNDMENDATELKRVYELSFLIVPTITEDKLPETVSGIKDLVDKYNPIFITEEFPTLRNLTYEMVQSIDTKKQKFKQAYFGWIKFEMLPDDVEKLNKELKNDKNILRFILVKTIKGNTLSSYKLFNKKDKEKEKATSSTASSHKKQEDTKQPEASQEEIDKSIEDLVIE